MPVYHVTKSVMVEATSPEDAALKGNTELGNPELFIEVVKDGERPITLYSPTLIVGLPIEGDHDSTTIT